MTSLARLHRESLVAPITVDWELAFTRPPTIKALDYWRTICGARMMPARRDLNPRAMENFLGHVSVVDVIPDPVHSFEYVVSLQGQHACEVLGHVAGRPLGDILSEELAHRWRSCFDHSRSAAAPVRLATRAGTWARNWLACEALLAPLGDEESGVRGLFCVFASWATE